MILTVGDKKPSLIYYLKRGGRALDLSTADSVTVLFTFSDDSTVEQAATIDADPTTGKVVVPIVDGSDASIITVAGRLTIDPIIHWLDADDDQHAEQPDVVTVREAGEVA